ncbi:hypothetical protein Val02_31930 [Virgisporangium aliadipatigenens]|uniref:AAA+ ATPase domain-containing protein n=1 Tax=Virgisporangium aliadipatigenens TaxID=741659 RepID=A0A8J3YKX3_9ACTN|nr:hypothetical protein Val02_31930 [Virgisporangium aliadipatigenens]
MAAAAGLSVRTVRNLELGQVSRPRRHTVEELAQALGLGDHDRGQLLRAARAEPAAADRVQCLPPDVRDFTGRRSELDALTALVDTAGPAGAVLVVHGPPGVGKTSLLVRAAHRIAADTEFPAAGYTDTCFVDLRGVDDPPLGVDEALDQLLTALGDPDTQLPASTGARLARYRMISARRSGLLVLDNAASEAQVRPLLPTGPNWLVLVSSRHALTGLSGVRRMRLDVLAPDEAQDLLADIVGPQRTAADPAAAARLAALCGHLPLALRVAGNRLADRPQWPIGTFTAQLDDEQRRLDLLRAGDVQVRSAFAVSYAQLPERGRRLLRRLPLLRWRQYPLEVAALLLGPETDDAVEVFEGLVDAGLLAPGTVPDRYVLHDLTAVFAAERLAAEEEPATAAQARTRVVDRLLDTVDAAGAWLDMDGPADPRNAFSTGVAALAWLGAQREQWWWAIRQAAADGRHARVLAANRSLYWYSDRHFGAVPWAEVYALGVAAAQALGDPVAEAGQRNSLGWVMHVVFGRPDEGATQFRRAIELARAHGDLHQEAWGLAHLGGVAMRRKPPDVAAAAEFFATARELFTRVGYRVGRVVTTYFHADTKIAEGDVEAAISLLTVAAKEWQEDGLALPTRNSIDGYIEVRLGNAYAHTGRLTDAIDAYDRALRYFGYAGDLTGSGRALVDLATALAQVGHPRTGEVIDLAISTFERHHDEARLSKVLALRDARVT